MQPTVASSLFTALMPNPTQVWGVVIEPEFSSPVEARVFDYFRCFIYTLPVEMSCKLLRFMTGKPQCSVNSIKVTFCLPVSDFERRPIASTCGSTLCLPTSYESFSSFSKEFNQILQNSHVVFRPSVDYLSHQHVFIWFITINAVIVSALSLQKMRAGERTRALDHKQ